MEIDGVLILWFVLTGLSIIYLLWDQFTNTPSMRIMTLAWALVILYTGPLGLFFYLISCRQPLPNTHDAFIKSHWKQALGSEIHCVAGDATAIIIMAGILSMFSLTNGLESILEYIAAYLFGLFIFQALFMLSMFKSYWEAVRKSIFAETVSMNYIMIGMLPIITVVKSIYPQAGDPSTLYFWGLMSAATIAGFVIGYPINSLLVKRGIKHGMMSKPQEGHEHHNHDHEHHHGHAEHEGHHNHEMPKVSKSFMTLHVLGSYVLLILVMWLMNFITPIHL